MSEQIRAIGHDTKVPGDPGGSAPMADGLLAGARWWRPDLSSDDRAALVRVGYCN